MVCSLSLKIADFCAPEDRRRGKSVVVKLDSKNPPPNPSEVSSESVHWESYLVHGVEMLKENRCHKRTWPSILLLQRNLPGFQEKDSISGDFIKLRWNFSFQL